MKFKKRTIVLVAIILLSYFSNTSLFAFDNSLKKYIPRLSPIPTSIIGAENSKLDLDGTWLFNPAPSADFYKNLPVGWANTEVPSEWTMQNFSVSKNSRAGYVRTFTIPADWKGKRIKLRCNAVYSDASVYINGHLVGEHSGGFTPFELDITEFAKLNSENIIAISVLNESVADRLASGSQYACHQLGGINRSISLFALPEINISDIQVKTKFDKSFKNAVLELNMKTANETNLQGKEVIAEMILNAPNGNKVSLSENEIAFTDLAANYKVKIKKPMKWDNEHPNLYTLLINLKVDGVIVESIHQKIGFRQVEVRANQLFVNGMPVKLRGSNHHEVYPTTGRSLPKGISLKDVALFREGNVNLLRTCHYPPDETLMHAADSLGMFIECEAPFCWSPGSGYEELVCRQSAEMVLAYRNHPSVLFWSLANESGWGAHFEASSELVRYLDPTRPQTFNFYQSDIQTVEEGFCEIANIHYPVHTGPAKARKYTKRPVYLGEDCHLNAYNRLELATDTSLRDSWGRYIREMWDDIDSTKGCLGQSIWSGIDDTFYMPNGDVNGYGTWGPIDGWRRKKPEFWGMKKAYSPIRILNSDNIEIKNKNIRLEIHNRQDFSNLSEVKINWKLGNQQGIAKSNIPARAKGFVNIKLKETPQVGEKLEISFVDNRGVNVDSFNLEINSEMKSLTPAIVRCETKYTESNDTLIINSGKSSWLFSKKNGQLIKMNNTNVSGAQLMILAMNNEGENQMMGEEKIWKPYTDVCTGWKCESSEIKVESDTVKIYVAGKYNEAQGTYIYSFANGTMTVDYSFIASKNINPRQIGIVFSLPTTYEHLSWERKGYWDVYPEDHISRLKGTVSATEGFPATSVGPRTLPNHPWRLDNLPYGNNDFCSTKENIIQASITNATGNGLQVNGNAKVHVRCWLKEKQVYILIAKYSNGGSERFLRGLTRVDDRPLKIGDKVEGKVNVLFK